ncbi:MAG: hypothetical protein ACW97X_00895 [Candidatus Hodarchaeales archaeon]|jgi:hypothetical protein
MASIISVTAGKLLLEFLKGYDDDPFGEQGLVIVKQLLDFAFPKRTLEEIISSEELRDLMTSAAAQYNFRKKPLFLAFSSFILEKSPSEIKKMNGNQIKSELIALIADDIDRPLPSLQLERSSYDLSGNPESAAVVRNSLEGALINTTASLFVYLLIGTDDNLGKIFLELDTNIRLTAERLKSINPLYSFLRAFLVFKWTHVSINGCLPTLDDLGVKDVCKLVEKNPLKYLEAIKVKFLKKVDTDLKIPLQSLINTSQVYAEKKDSNLDLDLEYELIQFKKVYSKITKDLKKIQSKVRSNKRVSSKEFESIKEVLAKEFTRIEKDVSKEFSNFEKFIEQSLFEEPKWFKYKKTDTSWQLESSPTISEKIRTQMTMKNAFEFEKKSKSLQKIMPIFEQLGGVHFALENILAHYFYDRVPSRLVKLVETPAKRQKIKILKFLQEMRYNEGIKAVRTFLISPSETLVSNLLTIGLSIFKESYIKENPVVSIDEEDLKNPRYLKLLDIPKELLDEQSPELFFGKDYFLYQIGEELINIGFHLKSINGKGNDLFGLLVSSAAYENALIYKQATRVLGNFSGYVNSTAIGNMKVCPPSLKSVDDLFM